MSRSVFALFMLCSLSGWSHVSAAEESTEAAAEDGSSLVASESSKDADVKDAGAAAESDENTKVTQHTVAIDGVELAYTATAREMVMKNDAGDKKARVFFVAYTKDGVDDPTTRPITFCFNGGPGSSSVWLHLGMLGPRRVVVPSDAQPARPPHAVVDNPFSLLDRTDLVFIDPVSTGYSRPAEDEDKKQFHGYQEDLKSVGQFIHDYTTEYGRWASPKFVLGESYGGLRAAGLTGTLQDRYNMYLNGVVLISAVVDFQTLRFSRDNQLPYALFLPSYTATAWYHKALPENLQRLPLEKVVERAERFAQDEYLPALLKGDALGKDERAKLVKRIARLTGLDAEYVDRSDLRLVMWRFGKELLRDREQTVGRFDSRYTGVDRDQAGESTEYDPSGAALFGPYTSAMNDYLHRELEYRSERVYEILTRNVQPWSYDGFENRYVNASETLRKAMTANPYLKVFAALGHYDLATPQYAMRYTLDHLGLPEHLRENLSVEYYDAGHMMYVHEPSLEKLRKDLLAFYGSALDEAPAEPAEKAETGAE
ncbi:MAG: peptidase S10 [Planctomycetota bacterium]